MKLLLWLSTYVSSCFREIKRERHPQSSTWKMIVAALQPTRLSLLLLAKLGLLPGRCWSGCPAGWYLQLLLPVIHPSHHTSRHISCTGRLYRIHTVPVSSKDATTAKSCSTCSASAWLNCSKYTNKKYVRHLHPGTWDNEVNCFIFRWKPTRVLQYRYVLHCTCRHHYPYLANDSYCTVL